jgi:hypothetical protein
MVVGEPPRSEQRHDCSFVNIDKKSYRKYLQRFECGDYTELFVRRINPTRKFDDEAVKNAVFGLLHEPPSNFGINRTTWIMLADLSRVLREAGRPACPEVIRKITKAAGYRWRKARVVLTSSDPEYSEKLDQIRSILSGAYRILGPRKIRSTNQDRGCYCFAVGSRVQERMNTKSL